MCLIVLKCMWLYWPVFIIKRVYKILQERVKPLGSLKWYTTNWYQSNWYTTFWYQSNWYITFWYQSNWYITNWYQS
jgi:hypothetical protein